MRCISRVFCRLTRILASSGNSGVFPGFQQHTPSQKEPKSSAESPPARHAAPAGSHATESAHVSPVQADPFSAVPVLGLDSHMLPNTEPCTSVPHEPPKAVEGAPQMRIKSCRFDGEPSELLAEQRMSSQAGAPDSAADSNSLAPQDPPSIQPRHQGTDPPCRRDQGVSQGAQVLPTPEVTGAIHTGENRESDIPNVASAARFHTHQTPHTLAEHACSSMHISAPQVCLLTACTGCY